MLGKPEIYQIFRELKGALINGCDPALLENGSATREVDLAGEPHCTQTSQRSLQFDRNQAIVSFKYNSRGLEVNLTPGALRAIGWDLEAMQASNGRNNRKIWAKPCIYGVAHLRDFKWLVSREDMDWGEVRQRLPTLVNRRITHARSKMAWIYFQQARTNKQDNLRPTAS